MSFRHLVAHCQRDCYDVYIGRASKSMPAGASGQWGNPFVMRNQSSRERRRVCAAYKDWLLAQPELLARARRELRGKVLGCFCAPKDCHGHILAEIANSDEVDMTSLKQSGTKDTATTAAVSASRDPDVITEKKSDVSSAVKPHASSTPLVDIGINVHNKQMLKTWRQQVQRASEANVTTILLTGTSLKCSIGSLKLVEAFQTEKPPDMNMNLYCTVGIHPHDAKSFQGSKTLQNLRSLLAHPLSVAVGECGLDYNRNFSTPAQQLLCFEEQVKLACEIQKPLFVHDREAHSDVVAVLSKYYDQLPRVVIHCFTGSASEASTYIAMGFYIGFTGTICKHERGKPLRDLLPSIPLDRILLETDAPFMGFVKGRRESEPQDVVLVAARVAQVLDIEVTTVREVSTANAKLVFNLP